MGKLTKSKIGDRFLTIKGAKFKISKVGDSGLICSTEDFRRSPPISFYSFRLNKVDRVSESKGLFAVSAQGFGLSEFEELVLLNKCKSIASTGELAEASLQNKPRKG